jgi:hypothetical protein
MSHEPEPWQTNEARPFAVIEKPKGTVSISSLGRERLRVEATGHDAQVEDYDEGGRWRIRLRRVGVGSVRCRCPVWRPRSASA